MCTNFQTKWLTLSFWAKICPKMDFRVEILKICLDLESASLTYYMHQFLDKTDNFEFLGPNLPKNEFWGQNFKNLSLDLESAPP